MFSHPHLNSVRENVNERQKTTELCSQFAAHDKVGLIGIYRPAFVQKIGTGLSGVQENKTLSEDMNVDDLA